MYILEAFGMGGSFFVPLLFQLCNLMANFSSHSR